MTHMVKHLLLASFMIGLMLGACPGQSSAADRVAEWAPNDALIYAGVPDFDEMLEDYKKTRTYQSLEDPVLKETVQPWKKLFENAKERVAEKLGLESAKELEIWPHGGVAVFLRADLPTGPDSEDDEPHIGLIADMGDDAEKARSLADKVTRHCVEKGARKETSEVSGATVTAITFEPDEDESEELQGTTSEAEKLLEGVELDAMQSAMVEGVLSRLEAPEEFAFAFAGSRLIVGTDAETVSDTLKRFRRGEEETFAATPAFRTLREHGPEKAHAHVVINLPIIIQAMMAEAPEEADEMRAVGADALGALVGAVEFAPEDGIDSRVRAFLAVDAEKPGIASMMLMKNIDTDPPPGVSADAAIYGSLNLDPPGIMKEVLAIAERMDPENAEQMRAGLKIEQQDGSVLDVQKDIVGQLRGPLTGAMMLARPFDTENCNLLFTLGHRSRDAIAKLADMLPPGMVQPSQMLGQTVYEWPMLAGAAMGFTDRVVIPMATKPALEAYIRSEGRAGRGLAETPTFKRVARHLPRQSCGVLYFDSALIADAQIAWAEHGGVEEPQMPSMADYLRFGLAQGSSLYDVDTLKAMRKYQVQFMMTMTTEADGLRIDGVSVPAGDASP